ncbi:hypothetical protein AVEN_93186-1 [Araneus ventricosus]|uniref:Uncharacterized protein n=1 Tax=Araneus ventricosus TaxID=182803 RepID=A0A4Y2K0N9_ARAVE|nr:hypothetical protein AVEN_93186-1 [Araneus ventricosus]
MPALAKTRWSGGKVSALRPDGSKFVTLFHRGLKTILSLWLHAVPAVSKSVGVKRLPLVWCGSLERGCQLRCCPLHLTATENYEVRPKISLAVLQNGTLIYLN